TLKALGDTVAQKTSVLEAQREVVERAVVRADRLDAALKQVDDGLSRQQEQAKALEQLQQQVAGLQSLHELVAQRSREVDQLQQESDAQVRSARAELAAARDEVRNAVERFDFESRGLDVVSERVADLRSALSDFEARFAGLAESKQAADVLQARTQALTAQLDSLASAAGRLDSDAGKIETLRRGLDEVVRVAQDATERVARIEEAR